MSALTGSGHRCGLPAGRRSEGSHHRGAGGGPGRALGGDSVIQRDRPDPGHRLFGQATARTRTREATRCHGAVEEHRSGERRPIATTRRRCQRAAPHL